METVAHGVGGASWSEILNALLSVILFLIGMMVRSQDKRIENLESFQTDVLKHWELDAKSYVTKEEFVGLAKELKAGLQRIEDKIEKLRG